MLHQRTKVIIAFVLSTVMILISGFASVYAENTVQSAPSAGCGAGFYQPGFELYIQNPDGSTLENEPEDEDKVKLTVKATLLTKPGALYVVAIYGYDSTMKSAEVFKSEAKNLYEHDFLQFITTYDSRATIKMFTLGSTSDIKPLTKVAVYNFSDCLYELPEKETEKEGITAYRGTADVYPAIISLVPTQIRSDGYWYSPADIEPIQVYYSGYDAWFRSLHGHDIIYNIGNINGKYILDSIESECEYIEFTCEDVVSSSNSSIVIMKNGEETEYRISPMCEFFDCAYPIGVADRFYFTYEDALYTAFVSDGKINGVNVSYSGGKVLEVKMTNENTIISDHLTLDTEQCIFVNGTPQKGDVLELFLNYDATCGVVIKSDPVKATVTEEGLKIGNNVFNFPEKYDGNSYIPGEVCSAYMNYDNTSAIYVKKDYSSKNLLIACGVEAHENGTVKILTTKGIVTLNTETVWINGRCMTPAVATSMFLEMLYEPTPLYYYYGADFMAFELPCQPEFVNGAKYVQPGIFGNYVAMNNTLIVANCHDYGVFTSGISLQNGRTYNAAVYSRDGFVADVIVIDDPTAATVTHTENFVVCSYDGKTIQGYSNGKLKSITAGNIAQSLNPGDYISITHTNGKLRNAPQLICSPAQYYATDYMYSNNQNTSVANHLQFSKVYNIVNGVLFTVGSDESTKYLTYLSTDTNVYVLDTQNNTLTPGSISDITRLYLYSYNDCDRVFVQSSNSVSKTIVVCK